MTADERVPNLQSECETLEYARPILVGGCIGTGMHSVRFRLRTRVRWLKPSSGHPGAAHPAGKFSYSIRPDGPPSHIYLGAVSHVKKKGPLATVYNRHSQSLGPNGNSATFFFGSVFFFGSLPVVTDRRTH